MLPKVEVTFLKLKRLRARSSGGGVLYNPTEQIMLEAYANHSARQSPVLTMTEEQEVDLGFPPFVLPAGMETLVIIANINQMPNAQPQDSAFNAWPRTMNYSPGMHTLQITKVYVMPAGPGRPKPTFIRVPGYELTYNVRYSDPGITIR